MLGEEDRETARRASQGHWILRCAMRELAEWGEQASWGQEGRMGCPHQTSAGDEAGGQQITMTNAACLLCARPCAKALCCPTTRRARHPDAILGLRLRQRGRQWPACSCSAKWWGCSGHPIPKPTATSVLLGLRGSASSWGQEGVYTRKWHDRKPPPSYRRSKGEGVDSGHEADRLLRAAFSLQPHSSTSLMAPLFCSKSPFTRLWHSRTGGWNLLGTGDPQQTRNTFSPPLLPAHQ